MDNKKILIIDDEEAIQRAIADALQNHGFSTIISNNGIEGLQIALKERPSLILLDILMPGMDGMNMMQNLRQDDWGKTVPVIILTNVNPNSSSVINSVLQNEPAYYLVKSDVRLENIIGKIKEVLRLE
jgi:two-component system, OmpR family, alkaline phosphatase synthesis response regulator PhoP